MVAVSIYCSNATTILFGLYFKVLQNLSVFRAEIIGMLKPVVGASRKVENVSIL